MNFPNGDLVTDEVEMNLNMLCALMSNWQSQEVSTTPLAIVRYTAFALERDTVF
jgi:hypothetical protein